MKKSDFIPIIYVSTVWAYSQKNTLYAPEIEPAEKRRKFVSDYFVSMRACIRGVSEAEERIIRVYSHDGLDRTP